MDEKKEVIEDINDDDNTNNVITRRLAVTLVRHLVVKKQVAKERLEIKKTEKEIKKWNFKHIKIFLSIFLNQTQPWIIENNVKIN